METTRVRLSQIRADEKFNARKHYDESAISNLRESIKRDGQLNPLIVLPQGKGGKYDLIVGFTRFKALQLWDSENQAASKETGKPYEELSAFVQIADGLSEEDAHLINLTENTLRKDLTHFETAQKCVEIADKYGKSGSQIAAKIHISVGQVNNLIRAMRKLHPSIIAAWESESQLSEEDKKGRVLYATTVKLFELAKIDDQAEQLELWNAHTGLVADADDAEDKTSKRKGAKDEKDGKKEDKPISLKHLKAAFAALNDPEVKKKLEKQYADGVRNALQFALGIKPKLWKVYSPEDALKAKAESDKGEDATAEGA